MQNIDDFIPAAAAQYCQDLISRHQFKLILTKERQTKLGDFRRDKYNNYTITVNRTLNPFQFLITFIHEYAHLLVAVGHPKSVKAHGKEWKNTFKELMLPILNPQVFPDQVLRPLANHMRNPKAASASDPRLWQALKEFSPNASGITLEDIAPGDKFLFKKRWFIKVSKRRTRVLCQEISSGKQYLIPAVADVNQT